MSHIHVTKTFLPPIDEYNAYIRSIFQAGIVTNQGPLLKKFEHKIAQHLNTPYFHYVANGTLALQLALSSLGIDGGEIITTPFSYVATTSSILWERCTPIFVDINPTDFNINVDLIEAAITPKTKAIMPVHVYGQPCDIDAIDRLAQHYGLKVIYDAAHCFGVKYQGKSIVRYGDISTLSFHATKVFHTVEGGGCVVRDKQISDILELQKRFGHNGDAHSMLGINAKASELHAAMGLVNLKYIDMIRESRKKISQMYDSLLQGCQKVIKHRPDVVYNYAYYPVLFESEKMLLEIFNTLADHNIYPRRYFWPSLNKLPYIQNMHCPVSEDISSKVACLPLYHGLEEAVVEKICDEINRRLQPYETKHKENKQYLGYSTTK